MSTRPFAGIDPGVSGALGFVSEAGQFIAAIDMPTSVTTTGRRQVDFAGLAAILRQYHPLFTLVERVGPRPGEGSVGAFSFGHGYGGLLGVLAAMGLAHDVVQPAVWKRAAHIPPASDKKCSVAVAARQLPEATPYLSRVKDHGRAEGLLLALQGLRWQQGGARVLEHKDIAMESED